MTVYAEDAHKQTGHTPPILFRPITDEDLEFLYLVYASTRLEELSITGWDEGQVESFLRAQFLIQHTQYIQKFSKASFEIILVKGTPAGRLYVERRNGVMHVIDIALLSEFRRQGFGGRIMRDLIDEADAKGLVMCLHVELNNPIIPFYKDIGLREIELRGFYYYMEREANKGA